MDIKDFENLDIKKFYSGKILTESYIHEKRFIKSKIETNIFELNFLLDKKKSDSQLIDIVLNQNKIILLGNPGIGKTKELEYLFKILWEKKKELEIIPFFINIKTFRNSNDFEDLIKYNKWKDFAKPCFIIDGLDEISDPQDFISALQFFLEDHNENIKIVLSCRTNIYEKFIVQIDDFEHYYLDILNNLQINNILEENFQINIAFEDLEKYRVFLENPFNLNLFGQFYKENGKFPSTLSEAFELSIDKELTLLNKKKFLKNELIDEIHAKHILKKVAIINELMHQNFIDEENLYYLVGEKDKLLVEKISFIEKNLDLKSFTFRHQNYQEFLSAKYISSLKMNEILRLIKINEINKTIPSLLNTISFLLNILEQGKFNYVKQWLLKYEPEVLFLLEKEKLDNKTQKEIFRKYFNEITVEKTFWFGSDRRFPMGKIAEFIDVEYLILTVKKNEYQRRIVKSGFDILSYCKPNSDELEKIKEFLILYIYSESDYLVDALQTFGSLNLHLIDIPLFLEICKHLKNNRSKDVHSQILFMFKDYDNIDDYFEIFKLSLEIECKIIGFSRSSRITWFFEEIILKTNIPQNFLEYYKILFDENSNLKLDHFYNHEFEEKFKQKTFCFVDQNPEFIINIFDIIFHINKYFAVSEEYILNLIIESNQKEVLFKHIIERYGITQYTNLPLSLIFEEPLISYFVQKLNDNSIIFEDDYNYEYFRNRLAFNNSSLAIKFENILIENGYKFKERWVAPEDTKNDYKTFCQYNFDMLFDEEEIVFEINKLFDSYNIEEINFKVLNKVRLEWYKNTGYHNLQYSLFSLIREIISGYNYLTKEKLQKDAVDIYTRLFVIRNNIDSLNNGVEFEINKRHIDWITKECINLSTVIDFQKIDISDHNTEGFYKFNVLKLLLYFDNNFNINYSKEFYFTILHYSNLPNLINNSFDFIRDRIGDLNRFNKQIILNINNNSIDNRTLQIHITYAISNKLVQAFPRIKEIILNKFEYIFSDKLIPDFALILPYEEKIEFLKKCIETDVEYLQWKAINILRSENLEKDFLMDFAKDYLNFKTNLVYYSSALDILFKFKDENFLMYFYKATLQVEDYQFFKSETNYGTIEKINFNIGKNDFELLRPLFYIIFNDEVKDSANFQNFRSLFESFIVNQSKDKIGFKRIRNILVKIKQNLFEKRSLFFHINLLIDKCEIAYYNSLSKSYSFKEAKELIDGIENPIQQNIQIMGDQFNFGEKSTFSGNQFGGQNNTQTNHFNSYSTNSDVLAAEEILKEFKELEIENEEWKSILIDGMKDLTDLKQAETEEEVQESKSRLQKWIGSVYDMGKKLNDWKNIAFLGVDFTEKTPKLLELMNHITKAIF